MADTIRQVKGIEELLELAAKPCTLADIYRSSVVGTAKFTGTDSLEEAIGLARRGWRGGTAEIERLRASIDKLISGSVPMYEPYYDVTGDCIDVGRFVVGEPEDFMTLVDNGLRRESPSPKIVRIVNNISASAGIGTETILRRGAALIVLIDVLERHGIRCRVDLSHCTQTRVRSGDRLEHYVTVKEDGEPISIDKLAFFMAHGSALRRIMFSVVEHESTTIRESFRIGRDQGGGYGYPGQSSDQGDIYLDRILSAVDWSEELTLAWLKLNLQRQGITLEEEHNAN